MGWDGSPRNYSMGIVLGNTPEKWAEFLRQTKRWLDRHPESQGIVTLNSWNEWVEGSYIEPDAAHGTKYLDAIRDVFSAKWGPLPPGVLFTHQDTLVKGLERPALPRVLFIEAWNEWTEGSYLEPDAINGMKYLEAVRDVFGTRRTTGNEP